MKSIQNKLRLLMATGSVFAFLGGWAFLAHAPKPAPLDPAPLDPAPAPNFSAAPSRRTPSTQLQPLPQLQPLTRPRLRTHGS